MALIPNGIPEKTIERLSEYRRTLLACHREGITHIFFARAGRDSRHYGCAGASGSDVDRVLERYQERLRRKGVDRFYQQHPRQRKPGEHRRNRYGSPGAGHHQIFQRKSPKLRITVAFDVDPAKVDTAIDNIPCYHMECFEKVVQENDISIVIVSSPTKVAPELVVPIINAGIKGVLNFTSTRPEFPARYLRGELRYYDSSGKGCLLRQGIRRE